MAATLERKLTTNLNEEYECLYRDVRERASELTYRHNFLTLLNQEFPGERKKTRKDGPRNPLFVQRRDSFASETQGLSSLQTAAKLELKKLRRQLIMKGGV